MSALNDEVERNWLRRMGEAEEACGSISVGGLASKSGVLVTREDLGDKERKELGAVELNGLADEDVEHK